MTNLWSQLYAKLHADKDKKIVFHIDTFIKQKTHTLWPLGNPYSDQRGSVL